MSNATTARYVPGLFGRATVTVAGRTVEVLATDEQGRPAGVVVPLDGGGAAVVQIGMADRSRWSIGYDGWTYDEWPTLEAAVDAVTTPKVLRQVVARTTWLRRVEAVRRELDALHDAEPARPVGALAQDYPRAYHAPF